MSENFGHRFSSSSFYPTRSSSPSLNESFDSLMDSGIAYYWPVVSVQLFIWTVIVVLLLACSFSFALNLAKLTTSSTAKRSALKDLKRDMRTEMRNGESRRLVCNSAELTKVNPSHCFMQKCQRQVNKREYNASFATSVPFWMISPIIKSYPIAQVDPTKVSPLSCTTLGSQKR